MTNRKPILICILASVLSILFSACSTGQFFSCRYEVRIPGAPLGMAMLLNRMGGSGDCPAIGGTP